MKPLICLCLCMLACVSVVVSQQPIFHPNFGTNGEVFINNRTCGPLTIASNSSNGVPIAYFPNGDILAASSFGFNVVKLQPNGRPDSTFGTNGFVYLYPGQTMDFMFAFIQPDNKIMLGGTVDGEVEMIRLLSNGSPDSSFNGNGFDHFDLFHSLALYGNANTLSDMLLQPDGKYLLIGGESGSNSVTGDGEFFPGLTRINPDGSTDSTFGNHGFVGINVTNPGNWLDCALHPDGSITTMVSMLATQDGPSNCVAYRYKANGLPDSTFGTNGVLDYTNIGPVKYVSKLLATPDGKYYAIGRNGVITADSLQYIVRYQHNGQFDSTFGNQGLCSATFPVGSDLASYISIDTMQGGNLLLFGYNGNDGTNFLASVTSAGSFNTSFGTQGFVLPHINILHATYDPYSNDIYTQQDDASYSFNLKRYTATGTPDNSFASNGTDEVGHGGTNDVLEGLAMTSDGRILTAGHANGCSAGADSLDLFINRYLPSGQPDSSFGVNGSIQFNDIVGTNTLYTVGSLIMLPGDGFLLGGTLSSLAHYGVYVRKYKAQGTLDSTFGANGTFAADLPYTNLNAGGIGPLVVQPDGRILFIANMDSAQSLNIMGRLTAQGVPDLSFGVNGYKLINNRNSTYGGSYYNPLALRPDGHIVYTTITPSGLTLGQLNSDGSVDPGFGAQGTAVYTPPVPETIMNPLDIKLQTDGKSVVLYGYEPGSNGVYGSYTLGLCRFNSDGSQDTSFFAIPSANASLYANQVIVTTDGRIVIPAVASTYDGPDGDDYNFAMLRLRPDGRADGTFGPNGLVTIKNRFALSSYAIYSGSPVSGSPNIFYRTLLAQVDSSDYILGGNVVNIGSDGYLTSFYAKDSVLPNDTDTTSITLAATTYTSACQTIKFSWTTQNDTASHYFSIQRASDFGAAFTTIATVTPIAHQKGAVQYFYTDSLPLPNWNWYRIQLVMGGDSLLTSNQADWFSDTSNPGTVLKPAATYGVSQGIHSSLISWTVDNQKTLDSITLLRSKDSGPFSQVGWQTPLPPANQNSYSYSDGDSLQAGHNYSYKVELYGADCVNAFSDTVTIKLPAADTSSQGSGSGNSSPTNPTDTVNSVKIYPNPAGSLLNVAIPTAFGSGFIEILSFDGRQLYLQPAVAPAGGVLSLNIGWLNPGIYYLKLINPQKTWVIAFLKL